MIRSEGIGHQLELTYLFTQDDRLKAHSVYKFVKAGDQDVSLELFIDTALAWLYGA